MRLRVQGHEVYAYTGSRPLVAAQPTIVFVHGAASDHSVWAWQSRYFAHHGRNVLAVDLPGHGRSDGDALASVEAIAEWIPALLDGASVASAAMVGHSMGALATLECAARHPARVERIALAGIAVPMEVSDDLMEAAGRNDHLAYELINGWSFGPRKSLGGNAVPGMWMTGNAMRLLERNRPYVLATDLMACRLYANGINAAAAVRCPALVITGARDILAPPRNATAVQAALPDARAVGFPDAGHSLMAEEPDAVLDALRTFVGQ